MHTGVILPADVLRTYKSRSQFLEDRKVFFKNSSTHLDTFNTKNSHQQMQQTYTVKMYVVATIH